MRAYLSAEGPHLVSRDHRRPLFLIRHVTATEYTTNMSHCTARRKSLALLLLVLILVVGICCLTACNSSVDVLAPVLVMLFVLLPVSYNSRPAWTDCAIPALGPYLPAAPDRAPPLQS